MAEDGLDSRVRAVEIGRTIRDGVASVVPQPLSGRIVEESLASAGIATVPSRPAELASFVRDHLLVVCAKRAGSAASEELGETLAPMLESLRRIGGARGGAP